MNITIEEAEKLILDQVKFVNFILEETRTRNEALREKLGMSYPKFVGVGTVYERFIPVCRDVKREMDEYLSHARAAIAKRYRAESIARRSRRDPRRPAHGRAGDLRRPDAKAAAPVTVSDEPQDKV